MAVAVEKSTRAGAGAALPLGLPAGRRSPRGRLRWYVLRVPEGRERATCERLLRVLPRAVLADAFALRKERWFKRGGVWRLDTVPAYRGTALAQTSDVRALAKALAGLTFPAELAGAFGASYMPLSDEAAAWLVGAAGPEHVLRNSVAVIEGGVLRVERGPLVGQEARVSRVDRHRRRCLVRVTDADGGFTECMPLDVPRKS